MQTPTTRRVELRFDPTLPQRRASESGKRVVYLSGGWGSGKTRWLIDRLIVHAAANPGLPLLLASPTYPLQRRTTIPTIVEHLRATVATDDDPEGRRCRWPSGRDRASDALGPLVAEWRAADRILRLCAGLGGGEVHLGSADVPGSLEGATYAGVFIDEPRLWSVESWRIALARLRHPRAAVLRAYVAGVPEMGWMWEELGKPVPGRIRIPAPTTSNPHLPRGYVESLNLSPRLRRAYIEGEFVHLSGAVFSGYDPDGPSVSDHLPAPGDVVDGCLDFGHRRPYFGAVAYADPAEQVAVFVGEVPGRDVLEAKHAQDVAALCASRGWRLRDVWCDPAGKARNAQTGLSSVAVYEAELRRAGALYGSMRWTTDPESRHIPNGIEAMNARLLDHLGHRRLFVHRSLVGAEYPGGVLGIHQSLLSLHYRDAEGSDPNPVHDEASHSTDAARYLMIGRYGVLGQSTWRPTDAGPADARPAAPDWAGGDSTWDGSSL